MVYRNCTSFVDGLLWIVPLIIVVVIMILIMIMIVIVRGEMAGYDLFATSKAPPWQ